MTKLEGLNSNGADLIWDEYKYRHDLIWRHMIRTTVAVIASITLPFTVDKSWLDTSAYAQNIMIAISFGVIIYFGLTVLLIRSELRLFASIKKIHRNDQFLRFGLHEIDYGKNAKEPEEDLNANSEGKSSFELKVYSLLSLLLLFSVGNLVLWISYDCKL